MEDREFKVKVHPHKLKFVDRGGWYCDGMRLQMGCKRGCTGSGQTAGWPRFKCIAGCDYDLCDLCLRFHVV